MDGFLKSSGVSFRGKIEVFRLVEICKVFIRKSGMCIFSITFVSTGVFCEMSV